MTSSRHLSCLKHVTIMHQSQVIVRLTSSPSKTLIGRSISYSAPIAQHGHRRLIFTRQVCSITPLQVQRPRLGSQWRSSSLKMMSSTSQPNSAIQDVLDFWFTLPSRDWFQDSSKHDEYITERFGSLVEKARVTDELDNTWSSTPSGSLALILLLDQFTRNIFRPGKHPDPGLSWSGDAKALKIASQSVAQGFDRLVQQEHRSHRHQGLSHRNFFYMPFMHAEDLPSQIACVTLYEVMCQELEMQRLQKELKGEQESEQEKEVRQMTLNSLNFATKHRDCIAAVGRFPQRNDALGREHTRADKEWLDEHPSGF